MIAIYARQSIDKKDSISIESQIEFGKREALDEEYSIYQDKGYSGKNTNRPAFEKMMEDIRIGKVNKVVVYRLDRVSRSIVDFADFINSLEDQGVSFVSATEKFDTSTPMGRAMLYIVVVFAQLERETIAERVKDNYYSRVKKGGLGGGPAPYGFDIVKTNINGVKMSIYEANEEIKNVVKIFDEYAKPNTSLADVQRFLAAQNIPTKSGKSWDNSKLASVLKSPAYVKADASIYSYYQYKGALMANDIDEFIGENGCVLVGKREANTRKYTDVTNHILALAPHEGVIDSDKFLYIQNKLVQNKQIKNLHKGKYSWLTGFVKCKHCGYAFSVKRSKTKDGLTNYFACSGRYLHKVCVAEQTHRVEDVETYVENWLIDFIKQAPTKAPIKKEAVSANLNKIKEIDARIQSLIISLENASSTSMTYINQRIEQLDNEKQEYLKRHSAEVASCVGHSTLPNYDLDSLSFEDKKNLAILLISQVNLSMESIEIVLK